ncbi:MAG: DUF1553 domain-containing protein [Paludibacter sp.]
MMRIYSIAIVLLFCTIVVPAQNIDSYFVTKGQKQALCSDEVFLRRAYLSVTGKLAQKEKATEFLNSTNSDKRRKLIDNLLESDDYLTYFGNLWGDMLRIKSEFPSNLWPNGVQAYNRWVHEKLTSNTPYNQIVNELLLSKGSNFRVPAVNFYRAFPRKTPDNIYNNIQLLFLGNRKPMDDGKVFFSQIRYKSTKEWKEEIVYVDYHMKPPKPAVNIDGASLILTENEDWRNTYVNWLTDKSNKRFAAVMANRMWYWVLGQGLVNEPDDWGAQNPPTKPELLNYLTKKFIASGYDMKAFIKEILISYAFQCAGSGIGTFIPERLNAEVIVDAIADISGISDQYNSRVPEPFSYFPAGTHSVELGDATVSSTTLELFGRASRDVSLERQHIKDLNARQLLFLMNSSELENKIRKSPVLNELCKNQLTVDDICKAVTLTILSRYPTADELQLYNSYASKNKLTTKQLCYDLVWLELNSTEFLYNH